MVKVWELGGPVRVLGGTPRPVCWRMQISLPAVKVAARETSKSRAAPKDEKLKLSSIPGKLLP